MSDFADSIEADRLPVLDAAINHTAADGACFAPDPRPWWKRVVGRFFRGWHGETPQLPEWAQDGLMVNTEVNFCFADRFRILLTGNVCVRTWTACENPPGRVETQSSAIAPLETNLP
jgi:hypothetical protein